MNSTTTITPPTQLSTPEEVRAFFRQVAATPPEQTSDSQRFNILDATEPRELPLKDPPADIPGLSELKANLEATADPTTPYTTSVRAIHARTHGFAQRIPGAETPRTIELLSRNERRVHNYYRWREDVWNSREGFPLPLALTRWLAPQLGIKRHPWNRFKKCDAVMSVDFVFTRRDGSHFAVDVKPRSHLKRARVKAKLRLAAAALALADVPHQVVDDQFVSETFDRNCRLLNLHAIGFDPPPVSADLLPNIEKAMAALLKPGRLSIRGAAEHIHAATRLPISNLIRTAFYCIGCKTWEVDMDQSITPDMRLLFLNKP